VARPPEGPLSDPFEAIDRLPESHPYRILGADALREGLDLFDDLAGDAYRGATPTATRSSRRSAGV